MNFKFSVDQAVEYTPRGGKAGLFTVVRQMPEEYGAFDRKYQIRNEQESFVRSVLECELVASDKPQQDYAVIASLRHTSRY